MNAYIKRTLTAVILLAFSISLASCFSEKSSERSFFSMDTIMSVKVGNADSEVLCDVENRIYAIEKVFGKNIDGSYIQKLNQSQNGCEVSDECEGLLSRSLEIAEKTDFSFNPCLGVLVNLWDVGKQNLTVPNSDSITELLPFTDCRSLTHNENAFEKSDPRILIDLGGIAKGYAAEEAVLLLRESGIENAMLDLGGNIAVMGESEKSKGSGLWRVGVKNPFDTSELVGVLNVSDCFVSVSGAYERFYEVDGKRYHHIIDPKTGYPAESDIESVAVISTDGVVADALSTALFVMGKDKALKFYGDGNYAFECVLIMKDGSVYTTEGLSDSFIPNRKANDGKGKYLNFIDKQNT